MNQTPRVSDSVLQQITNETPSGSRRRLWTVAVIVLIVAAVVALVAARSHGRATAPKFLTEAVTRGDLTVTVSATGNLKPTNQVDVGSEVSGLVESVYVDDNDTVTKGQVLARLDTSRLDDEVVNAKASLAAANAKVEQAVANVQESTANLDRLRQAFKLSHGKVPSANDLEKAEAALAIANADESSARAAVEQAQASVKTAETTLSKASIRSPIDGVVLDRQIEPGQTVAASFQAPVLFTLAEDLSTMELEVDVDEADVGQVKQGQHAEFTVDAYPGRTFPAVIRRVGLGSETTDGVVSYKAVLSVDNGDLSLRPGMTATAEITTVEHKDVLLVPNAALRFTPPATSASRSESRSIVSRLLPGPPGRMGGRRQAPKADTAGSRVWVLTEGAAPVPVPVTPGMTDGRRTEITSGNLKAGAEVVTEAVGGTT